MSGSESETEAADLSSPDVTTKYRTVGEIVQKALQAVVDACQEGADVGALCELGDSIIEEETSKVYNKKIKDKKVEKGVAFPTCVSINEVLGHFSPLKADAKKVEKGDFCKIDMAGHIDGFIAAAAHTVVVAETDGAVVDGKRADVVKAAWTAAEAALRLVKPGNKNVHVTEAWGKIAEDFGCVPVQGVLSHEMKRNVIDGQRAIISAEGSEEKVEEFEFQMNEVYCIDILMSSGDGRGRETSIRNTVYKRAADSNYSLKTQKARQFMFEVQRRFPSLPFSLRAFEDEQVARVGVSEAKRHELLEEFPVLREKDGAAVAQFKFTVLLLPGGTKKIGGLPFGSLERQICSTRTVEDEDIKRLLATSVGGKRKKKPPKEQPQQPEQQEQQEESGTQ